MFAREGVTYCWHWSRLFWRMATGAHVLLDTVTFPWRALLGSCCSNTSKWHQTDEVDGVPLQSAVRWAHTDMKSEGSPLKANARWDTCGKKVEVANLQTSKGLRISEFTLTLVRRTEQWYGHKKQRCQIRALLILWPCCFNTVLTSPVGTG